MRRDVRAGTEGIAIVGMAARFPGAPDVAAFWQNLCAGVESIERFEDAHLEDAFSPGERAGADFVAARSVLDDSEMFDAPFFAMHAREAELTDPQHRVLLECAWSALEDAGCDPAAYRGAIGVVAGCSISTYLLRHVLRDAASIATFTRDYQAGSFPELIGSGHDFVATRIAYKLDLRGPAMTVQSACSTSLLAVAQAAQALMLRQADVMLAGAASITYPQRRGVLRHEGGIVSSDGHCRSFDERSSGTVFGSGAGVVALKRLEDARADGDRIYAVIRGFGVNNDGSAKIGYTAPSVAGQAAAIAAAHAMAEFEPSSIGFVECHGTGTPLGDPIEVAALTAAFAGCEAAASCALGSVKTNIGHLDVAAGMSGLIKTALAIHHGTIPPTLHYTAPNPHIDFANGPFFVNTTAAAWPDARRRAGVSAFGLGGTNVHVVLDAEPPVPRETPAERDHVLVLSARTETALAAAAARLARRLRDDDAPELGDVAFTLLGRRAFPFRLAVAASTAADAAAALASGGPGDVVRANAGAGDREVAFLLPGQGAQYPGMGRALYASSPVFRAAFDRCAESVAAPLARDLRALVFADASDDARALLSATQFAQPAIFAIEYALAQMWIARGIRPCAMIGHSVGEFAAACLAGVMTLDDALAVVAERGRLIAALPRGAMVAVTLSEDDLVPLLGPELRIAAVNGPGRCVASGPFAAIETLERALAARDAGFRRLETSHAFHSAMMDAVIAPLTERLARVDLREPQIPYVSGVTGTWIGDADATSPAYWARHASACVRYAAAVTTLAEDGLPILLEVGPGSALGSFARQTLPRSPAVAIVASLPGAQAADSERHFCAMSLGRLWAHGATPDRHTAHGRPRLVSLPTYPFEREPYLAAALAPAAPSPGAVTSSGKADMDVAPNDRRPRALALLASLLEELSGERVTAAQSGLTFLELGFDSLFLGRFAQQLRSRHGISVTFRQLLGEIPTLGALAELAADALPPEVPAAPTIAAPPIATVSDALAATAASSPLEALMRDQLAAMQTLMRDQLAALAGRPAETPPPVAAPAAPDAAPAGDAARFAVYRPRAAGASAAMTEAQRAHVDALVARTVARTAASKELTRRYRHVLADPRAASGFRSEWKEMVYPIACARAQGSRLWDVDGNEYVDILNGFGQTAFGHAPAFVVDAVALQLQQGFAIGPQAATAGEVAELFCEITGNERATFCNTGSEAVMAAMRVARTVTGRDRVVVFSGSYHGQFDEVLVKGARTSERSLPVAPGIPEASVSNVRVLDYGTPESLAWIREHAGELAAVVVEPVQSRHPNLQPHDFLRELREITERAGAALVFDEVVTGFRMHPAGMQHLFDVRADLATYGKVVGGGLPIGILAGSRRFMDALDGGTWEYGDDSIPEVAPTFFAGTFVRHPLVLAAVRAVLLHVRERGAALQLELGRRTAALVERLNAALAARRIVSRVETCGSLFHIDLTAEDRLAGLFFYHMRERGIYVQEGFPCFLTTAHTEDDLDLVARAFEETLDALCAVGILGTPADAAAHAGPIAIAPTEQQIEIWLAAQLGDDASRAFNESITLRLTGDLDEAALLDAWNAVCERHESLRGTFDATGETFTIVPHGALPVARTDLSSLAPSESARELDAVTARDARETFDLVRGPLARGHLLRLASDAHAFVFTAHHIVCDGWSINVILEEVSALYAARVRGIAPALAAPLAFSTYARMQRERPATLTASIERFWLERFADPVAPLDLPSDRPRAATKSFAGATRSAAIDAARAGAIKKAGARAGGTLFATLLGAFIALAGRLAARRDVVVCIPTAGQALLADDRVLVGHCVDFLPIRHRWNATERFTDLIANVTSLVLDAHEHQDYTLGTLVRALAARDGRRPSLTELQFNLERLSPGLAMPGIDVRIEPNPKAFVNFDLFLNVIESSDGLRLDCDYNTDLFEPETIDRYLAAYVDVLDRVVADAGQTLDAAPRTPAVPAALAVADPARDYPREATVHGLVAARANETPDAVAAVSGTQSLTYAELDRRANALAHRVLQRTGGPGARVGIALERGFDLLVALLAVMKAGAAYVPLDASHGDARLRFIAEDANLAAVITGAAGAAFVPAGVPIVALAGDVFGHVSAPDVAIAASDPAYAIYTSGSTGKPKGVVVTHRSVVNLLTSMAREPGCSARDVLVAVTTVAFDIAALELFLPLVTGATVAIADPETCRDGFRLKALLETTRATILQGTPATWRLLLEAGFSCPAGLTMLCGGEALPRDLADRLLAGDGPLWNMYGPTETTIWSSCARVTSDGMPISVGTPIANTRFSIRDAGDRPLEPGVVGQLHIAGDGVALGYVNRPDLTAAAFVTDPLTGERTYRTGDLARQMPSGAYRILGRIDDQVKLRGFRIELGEIEAVLAETGAFAASAVAFRDDAPGPRLACYYVGRSGAEAFDPSAFAARLARLLPEYMIPREWVALEALPLNGNGKLDRAALRALPPDEPCGSAFERPETPTEIVLGTIWRDVLGLERVSVTADLFALGADSINLFQITARANREGVPLLAKQLLANRTIRELGRYVDAAATARAASGRREAPRMSRMPSLAGRDHANA